MNSPRLTDNNGNANVMRPRCIYACYGQVTYRALDGHMRLNIGTAPVHQPPSVYLPIDLRTPGYGTCELLQLLLIDP